MVAQFYLQYSIQGNYGVSTLCYVLDNAQTMCYYISYIMCFCEYPIVNCTSIPTTQHNWFGWNEVKSWDKLSSSGVCIILNAMLNVILDTILLAIPNWMLNIILKQS